MYWGTVYPPVQDILLWTKKLNLVKTFLVPREYLLVVLGDPITFNDTIRINVLVHNKISRKPITGGSGKLL